MTSRERLRIGAEQAYAVPALDPNDGVALFLGRSAAAGLDLGASQAVDELCARLEQLPLALELAAARAVVFSPEQLLERLAQRLDLLKGDLDADERQQTLRATIDWSYELLDDMERAVFRSLSVFLGGCDYDAAEQVANADPDILQSLLDKSLVRRREAASGQRYWMLETIREFAAEKLVEHGDWDDAIAAHARFFASFARASRKGLWGSEQASWMIRLDPDLENVLVALETARAAGDTELGIDLVSVNFWLDARGHRTALIDALLAFHEAAQEPVARAELARRLGESFGGVDNERSISYFREAAELHDLAGDDESRASVLANLATNEIDAGRFDDAAATLDEALTIGDRLDSDSLRHVVMVNVSNLALNQGDWQKAADISRELAAITDQPPIVRGVSLNNLALALAELGGRDELLEVVPASLALHEEIGWLQGVAYALVSLASGVVEDRPDDALSLVAAADVLMRDSGLHYERFELSVRERVMRRAVDIVGGREPELDEIDVAGATKLAESVIARLDAPA